MKIKDVIYKLSSDSYVAIKSLDCAEEFVYANKRSEKLKKYYDRDILDISLDFKRLQDSEDQVCKIPCIVLLIQHKENITVKEAIDKMLNRLIGNSEEKLEELKLMDQRINTLLEIKDKKLSVDEIYDQRDLYTTKVNKGFYSSEDFEIWTTLSELLMELGVLKYR